MGTSPPPAPPAHPAPGWTRAQTLGPPPRGQWDFLCQQDGLPGTHDAHRLGEWQHDLWLLPALAPGRYLGTPDGHAASVGTSMPGRLPEPSAACADSQSIKGATQGKDVGFDGNKQVKGRKRHILVDTLGLILVAVVTAANTDDRQGLVMLLTTDFASGVTRLRQIWVDKGSEAQWLREWARRLKQTHKMDVEVVERTGKGFEVVKQRWQVERSCAWLVNDRRHSRDDEVWTAWSEAMIHISMIRLLLKRLA
jgi:transposase